MTTSSTVPPDNSFPVYAPVSVTPVEHTGWRVVYEDPNGGASTEQIVAWGVFGLTWKSLDTGEVLRDDGTVIEAVVPTTRHRDGHGYVHLGPAWNEDFVCYLPPGAPDPGTGPSAG